LQCVLAARILTVDFVVCTLAVKRKSGQVSTCRIGPFPCKFYPCPLVITNLHGPRKKTPFSAAPLSLQVDSLLRERVYRAVAQK
jgi:hypothetical protein